MGSQQPIVTFEPLYPDVVTPERAPSGAAGYDVRAHLKERTIEILVGFKAEHIVITSDHLVLQPGVRAAIPLGFRAMLPVGFEAQLRLRSSTAFRKGIIRQLTPRVAICIIAVCG